MGRLDPNESEEWTTLETYEVNGHTVEIKSGGYLHTAGLVNGQVVAQNHDRRHWVKEEAETHARYLPQREDRSGSQSGR